MNYALRHVADRATDTLTDTLDLLENALDRLHAACSRAFFFALPLVATCFGGWLLWQGNAELSDRGGLTAALMCVASAMVIVLTGLFTFVCSTPADNNRMP